MTQYIVSTEQIYLKVAALWKCIFWSDSDTCNISQLATSVWFPMLVWAEIRDEWMTYTLSDHPLQVGLALAMNHGARTLSASCREILENHCSASSLGSSSSLVLWAEEAVTAILPHQWSSLEFQPTGTGSHISLEEKHDHRERAGGIVL